MTEFKWGTVTSVSPLRIKLDASTTELPFTPDSLVDPALLAVTNRVRCDLSNGRVVIVGKSGGVAIPPQPDASTTVKGIVELSTDAEGIALTDALRAIPPSVLAAVLDKYLPERTIYPTVSSTGGSVSIDSNTGLITFTGVTAIMLDGLTSDYRDYDITFQSTGTASTVAVTLRTTAPADISTGYDMTYTIARNSTVASGTNVSQASWGLNGVPNTVLSGRISTSDLALAAETRGFGQLGAHSNPAVSNTSNDLVHSYFTHQSATAYGGLKLTFSAARSGTLKVTGKG